MKKQLFIVFSALLLLSACSQQTSTPADTDIEATQETFNSIETSDISNTDDNTPETSKPEDKTETSDTTNPKDTDNTDETAATAGGIETSGVFEYFALEAPTEFKVSALKKVCFTPAQFDTTNDGNMFCFTNTEEALKGLKIEANGTCKKYMGYGTVEIKNLTDQASNLKTDTPEACANDGTCKFDEAEFVLAKEIPDEAECNDRI